MEVVLYKEIMELFFMMLTSKKSEQIFSVFVDKLIKLIDVIIYRC